MQAALETCRPGAGEAEDQLTRRLRGRGLNIFEGTGGYGARHRGPGPLTLAVTALVVLALLGAGGWVLYRRLNPDNSVPLMVLGVDGPVAGAVITGPDGETATTGEEGTASLSFVAPASLTVAAPGYQNAVFNVQSVPEAGDLGLQLEPLVLKGRVTDPQGNGIAEAAVHTGERETTTDALGSGGGTLPVRPGDHRPGHGPVHPQHQEEHRVVRVQPAVEHPAAGADQGQHDQGGDRQRQRAGAPASSAVAPRALEDVEAATPQSTRHLLLRSADRRRPAGR